MSSCLVIWGCRKFLLLFGRIGPLALRPCARVFFATFNKYHPNSMLIWYVLRSPLRPLAQPCIFDASISCSQNPISPEDVIERTGVFINPHIFIVRFSWHGLQHLKNSKFHHLRGFKHVTSRATNNSCSECPWLGLSGRLGPGFFGRKTMENLDTVTRHV